MKIKLAEFEEEKLLKVHEIILNDTGESDLNEKVL